VAEVLRHRHGGQGGPERYLNKEQEAELKAKAEAGEIRTIQDGVEWAKTHDVAYTYWGMRGVFGRLGLKNKVPRPKSPQTSDEEQEAWKKGDCEPNSKK
jgi:transposase